MIMSIGDIRKIIKKSLLEHDNPRVKSPIKKKILQQIPGSNPTKKKITWIKNDPRKEVINNAFKDAANKILNYWMGPSYKKVLESEFDKRGGFLHNSPATIKNNKKETIKKFRKTLINMVEKTKVKMIYPQQEKDGFPIAGYVSIGGFGIEHSLGQDYKKIIKEDPKIVLSIDYMIALEEPGDVKDDTNNPGEKIISQDYLKRLYDGIYDTSLHEIEHIENALVDILIENSDSVTKTYDFKKFMIDPDDIITKVNSDGTYEILPRFMSPDGKTNRLGNKEKTTDWINTFNKYLNTSSRYGMIELRARIAQIKTHDEACQDLRSPFKETCKLFQALEFGKDRKNTAKDITNKYNFSISQILLLINYDKYSIEKIGNSLDTIAKNSPKSINNFKDAIV